VGFTSPKEDVYDCFLESVSIGVMNAPKEWTLDQYVQSNINTLRNNTPDLKILESIPTTLADMPAYKFVYDTHGYTYHNLVLNNLNDSSKDNKNNIYYMILYMAETNKYSIFLPIAQEIINSFKFIN